MILKLIRQKGDKIKDCENVMSDLKMDMEDKFPEIRDWIIEVND